MREGFTTGSCAAAAAKAAAYMLFSGRKKESIDITVPRGDVFHAEIVDVMSTGECVRCAVVKDGGDDPDVTSG
ncbi:MAG TPA: cobalt-precorrin-6A synthase, partial [Lachnospiraceae bacterium]|nr:cobalt-precorrin-6A synthase [Lachnospiraceae bacterium]